ncbi:unnamed protein product, partial [Phaeothamnion confervicola]
MATVCHPNVTRLINAPRIQQRTDEWMEFRRIRLTASDASKVLAKGGKSRTSLFLEKVGDKEPFSGNDATTSGTRNEENALNQYKNMYPGAVIFDNLTIMVHDTHDELAASLDAVTADGINLELKTIHGIKLKSIPKAYRDQVQLQMEVCNLETTHLVQYYIDLEQTVFTVIGRDREWFETNRDSFLSFVHEVRE